MPCTRTSAHAVYAPLAHAVYAPLAHAVYAPLAHAVYAPLAHAAYTHAAVRRVQRTLRGTSAPGGASGSIYESFANSTPNNAGWVIGGAATLTSGTTDGATGVTDPSGAGWLRLTSESTTNSVGYAYYNTPLTLTNGLIIGFDYTCWGGHYGPYPNNGADGASFYLFDGSTPFSVGAAGGSLGYKGMAGAYVGRVCEKSV